jgi:hypothetical protein
MPELPAAVQFDSPPEIVTFMGEAEARSALTGLNPFPEKQNSGLISEE